MRLWKLLLMRRGMGDEYIPHATPRKSVLISVTCGDSLEAIHSIAGKKEGEGGKGGQGLARDGARWPSGARSHPNQTDQVAGRAVSGFANGRIAKKPTLREKLPCCEADKKAFHSGISLRLCASAVNLRASEVMGVDR